MNKTHPDIDKNKQAYIVRFWRGVGEKKWRIAVQDVASAEKKDFTELQGLFRYFRKRIKPPDD